MNSESHANGVSAEGGLLDLERGPALAGTRITIYTILEYLIHGRSREHIAELLRVSVAHVQAAIDYIAEHDLDVLREYVTILERIRRGNSPEVEAILAANRPYFEAFLRKVREAQARGEGQEAIGALLAEYRQERARRNSDAGNRGGQ